MNKKDLIEALPRIIVGILFLVAGIGKLMMGVDNFSSGMIENNFGVIGLTGSLALISAWIVTIVEIIAGAVLIAGKLAPYELYKWSIRVLIVITLMAAFFVQWGNAVSFLKDILIVVLLAKICHSKIACPMGITGDKLGK